jgi:hypothetical protein
MMKFLRHFILILIITSAGVTTAQIKIGDNANTIDPRSILELESKTKALYLPRLTTAEIGAQSGWKPGMFVYNTTDSCIQFFNGNDWFCLTPFVSPDEDQDSTNELQSFVYSNDTLYLTNGNEVFLGDYNKDSSATNELQSISVSNDTIFLSDGGFIKLPASTVNTDDQVLTLSNDTLYIEDGNQVYLGNLLADQDQDSTNEYNTGFEVNGTGDSLIITDAGTRFAVAIEDVIDTSNLYAQILLNRDSINLNEQGIIDSTAAIRSALVDSTAAVRTALVDTASAIRTALNNHITNDEDTDSTNEYNTGFEVNGTGDSLIITDAGTRFAVAIEDVIDTSNLYAQILLNRDSINLNEQGIIDSTTAVRSALVDTASAIRTALNNHITNDEDTDSTNEYNTGFEVNGTGDSLIITDEGTRFAVAIGDVIDTSNLYAQILLNRDSINLNEQGIIDSTTAVRSALVDTASAIRTALNNHITNDEDTDSTNEYNTGFEVNGTGDSLIISDAGTRFAVAIGDVIDTSNLYAQILLNRDSINLNEQGIIDSASAIRTALNAHISADNDVSSTNELNSSFGVVGTNLRLTDAGGNLDVPLTDIIDTSGLSNRIDENEQAIIDTASAIRTTLNSHINADEDTDSTNEYNTGFELNGTGDSLILTDAGTRFAVAVSDAVDTTNLYNQIMLNRDSINLNEQGITDSTSAVRSALVDTASAIRTDLNNHINSDEDKDSTNELVDSLVLNKDSLTLYENGSSYSVKLKYVPTYLCKDTNGITDVYRLKENANVYISEIDTSVSSTYEELLDSGYATCESGQTTLELTDCKRREVLSDSSSAIVYFNDSVDVYDKFGVLTSYTDYSTWFSGAGVTVTKTLNCFDEECLQIGNVQYKDGNGDNIYVNIDNSTDTKSLSALKAMSAIACTPISCQQVYGRSDFGLDGTSGLPDTDPDCPDLSATWFDANSGELFSWDVSGAVWVQQPSVTSISCPQASISASGTILSSVGVASVTRSATGRYKITLASPQSSSDYVVILTKDESTSTRDALHIDVQEGSKTATAFEVIITEGDNGTGANPYRDRNWYFSIPCEENFSTGIDSMKLENDSLTIFESDTSFSVLLTDTDSTNEYNTGFEVNGTSDSLIVTDAGTRFAVAIEDVVDTSNLYAQILLNRDSINLNEQGIIDSTAAVRSALVDTASAIRTALNDHITSDEDTDSTNEYNTGFEVNGTGDSLIISDAGTRFAVALEDVIDTSNLYTQIMLNRDSINLNEQGIIDSASAIRTALNAHISADNDVSSTNELNSSFGVVGTNLRLTDAGGNLDVPLTDIIDTSGLSNRIDENEQAIIDTASAIRTTLNSHINADEDTDSTNEYNTGFELNGTGDSLVVTDAGTRFAVAIEDVIDTSNLYAQILLNRDSINLNEQGIIDSTSAVRTALVDTASAIRTALNDHITSDEDTDSTNEYNTGFDVNGTGDSLIITDAGTRFAVAIEDVIDTSNLYAQILLNRDSINFNEQGIIDSTAAVRTALVDTASAIRTALNDHITNDEDTDSTNEYNTGFDVNGTGDSLIITDAGTRFAVAIEDVIDTSNLYAQILLNRDSINLNEQGIIDSTSAVRTALVDTASAIRTALNDHITNDEDTDSTNEYNTGFEVNGTGDSLIISDAGTRFAVAIEDVIDTSNLYAQILLNRDSINFNEQGIIDSTAAVRTALVDTASDIRGALIDTASNIRTSLNQHINEDEDKDSTNELIKSVSFDTLSNGLQADTLKIQEADTTYAVRIETWIKAAGKVSSTGAPIKVYGATVSRINQGDYQITFTQARPDANYIIQLSLPSLNTGNDDPGITYYDQQTSGFKVNIGDNDNGGTASADVNSQFMFTVIDFDF